MNQTGTQLVLAEQGRSEWTIVLASGATAAERRAAEELQSHLREMSGAELPIREGTAPDAELPIREEIAPGAERPSAVKSASAPREIRVGYANDVLPEAEADGGAFGAEEFLIRTVGESLWIVGGRPRGVLYGVYAFLERVLGCRWYTAGVSVVPKRETIAIGPLELRDKPRLEYREPFFTEARDPDWAVRNAVNGHFPALGEERGGRVSYIQPFVHTFESLVSPKEYFDEHPEYFSEIGGKRLRENTQLCLTNEDVFRLTLAKVREWIEANPEASIVSVSQNDWENPCECASCRAIDEEEGNYSGTLLRFVNRIAEALEPDYPHIAVDTLAYQYTRKPPKLTRPRHNVIVRLCSIECCFSHPLESCGEKLLLKKSKGTGESFPADLEAWGRICNRLYVWDYVTNFVNYVLPFPNYGVLQPNLRLFARNNVKGVFEQGSYSKGGGGEFAELRAYVLAKLLWNPDANVSALMDEFLTGVYGPGGIRLREYIDELTRVASQPHLHASIFDRPDEGFLTPEVLALADRCFDEAEALAEDEATLQRLRRARLPIRYAKLCLLPVDAAGRDEALDAFFADVQREGIEQLTEHVPARTTIERLRQGVLFTHEARYENGWSPFDEAVVQVLGSTDADAADR